MQNIVKGSFSENAYAISFLNEVKFCVLLITMSKNKSGKRVYNTGYILFICKLCKTITAKRLLKTRSCYFGIRKLSKSPNVCIQKIDRAYSKVATHVPSHKSRKLLIEK